MVTLMRHGGYDCAAFQRGPRHPRVQAVIWLAVVVRIHAGHRGRLVVTCHL